MMTVFRHILRLVISVASAPAALATMLALGLVSGGMLAAIPALADGVYGDPGVPVAGRVLGMEIRTQDPEELRYMILRQLTNRYAAERGIAVSQAEIEAYVDHMQTLMAEDRRQHEARRDELTRTLASEELSEADRKSITSELKGLNEFLAALADTTDSEPRNAEEIRSAREQIAAAFIFQFKINRALHKEYGGRIGYQQGGPEPLDAYRWFLEERQARGEFDIPDKNLEAAFWRYYDTDAIHSFFVPGSEEEARAFQAPWLQPDQ
jgi:hypothetical protein